MTRRWRAIAWRRFIWPLCASLVFTAGPGRAEIHDYMILRLVYLNTSCGTQKFGRVAAERSDWRRFHVECRNVNAYPHGLYVTCTDVADDRSCKVETSAKTFDNLELLQPLNRSK